MDASLFTSLISRRFVLLNQPSSSGTAMRCPVQHSGRAQLRNTLAEIGEVRMRRQASLSTSAPKAFTAVRRGSAIESLWTVDQRLANAERELRIQFSRIAQLQGQLDVLLGALRRSPGGVHV